MYLGIDSNTRAKVQFGSPNVLLDYLHPHQLPTRYGGTMEGDWPVHYVAPESQE